MCKRQLFSLRRRRFWAVEKCEAIAAKLREREKCMIRGCEVANHSPDILAIEQDWDALDEAERIEEPWNIASTR